MHEMSLAQGVLDLVRENARRAGVSRVTRVRLEIGELSAVEPQALRFCFGAVVAGSLAADAALEIVEVPGSAWCIACAKPVRVASRAADCPECGGAQLQVTGGDRMRVIDFEGA